MGQWQTQPQQRISPTSAASHRDGQHQPLLPHCYHHGMEGCKGGSSSSAPRHPAQSPALPRKAHGCFPTTPAMLAEANAETDPAEITDGSEAESNDDHHHHVTHHQHRPGMIAGGDGASSLIRSTTSKESTGSTTGPRPSSSHPAPTSTTSTTTIRLSKSAYVVGPFPARPGLQTTPANRLVRNRAPPARLNMALLGGGGSGGGGDALSPTGGRRTDAAANRSASDDSDTSSESEAEGEEMSAATNHSPNQRGHKRTQGQNPFCRKCGMGHKKTSDGLQRHERSTCTVLGFADKDLVRNRILIVGSRTCCIGLNPAWICGIQPCTPEFYWCISSYNIIACLLGGLSNIPCSYMYPCTRTILQNHGTQLCCNSEGKATNEGGVACLEFQCNQTTAHLGTVFFFQLEPTLTLQEEFTRSHTDVCLKPACV